jgi:hypothetical protein
MLPFNSVYSFLEFTSVMSSYMPGKNAAMASMVTGYMAAASLVGDALLKASAPDPGGVDLLVENRGLPGNVLCIVCEGMSLTGTATSPNTGSGEEDDFWTIRQPKYDGSPPTWGEATWHWRNKGGEPLTVDLNKVDLSGSHPEDFKGPGSKLLYTLPKQQFYVFGQITLRMEANGQVTALPDTYNFDMKYPFMDHLKRNLLTLGDKVLSGPGTPFKIFSGTASNSSPGNSEARSETENRLGYFRGCPNSSERGDFLAECQNHR